MATRVHIMVRGIVQGVGFRPFVFSQASRRSLTGRVLNNTSGVLIDVEGDAAAIQQFVEEIKLNPPPRSIVEAIECSGHLPRCKLRRLQHRRQRVKRRALRSDIRRHRHLPGLLARDV